MPEEAEWLANPVAPELMIHLPLDSTVEPVVRRELLALAARIERLTPAANRAPDRAMCPGANRCGENEGACNYNRCSTNTRPCDVNMEPVCPPHAI